LPGSAGFNLRASYQIDKTFQVYARGDNVFDNRYANYVRYECPLPISTMVGQHPPIHVR
jgi:outer membrane cobalamin receptor